MIRCALESLALRCRMVLGWLESLIGTRVETVHIVGGGTQNRQLCQMTANACNRTVLAGPVEATAIGNVMMQAIAARRCGLRSSRPVRSSPPASLWTVTTRGTPSRGTPPIRGLSSCWPPS